MALPPGETARQRQLKQLSQRFPVANQNIAQGLQAANVIQQQQALVRAQPETAGIRAAQQAGTQQTATAGQVAAGQASQAQNQAVQMGQLNLAEQGRAQREQLAGQQMGLAQEQMNVEDRLDRLGQGYKQELYNKQMSFQKDQLGQSQLNNRQLVDWAVLKAKNAEEMRDYAQTVQLASQRQEQLYRTAAAKVEQAIKQGYLTEKQQLDGQQRQLLAQMKLEADRNQAKKARAARNTVGVFQAAGTIAGAVIGGIYTGGAGAPAGAAAGGAIGGGVGTAVGGLMAEKQSQ